MSDSKSPASDADREMATDDPDIAAPAAAEDTSGETADAGDLADLAGFIRLGPGTLDSLRFKWTVRHEAGGYFVDETIGASQSPVSRGPMSRAIALDYIEARYRDATARFEHRRDRLANAPLRPRRPPPPLPSNDTATPANPPADAAPDMTAGPEEPGLAQEALLASATVPAEDVKKDSPKTVDLEDVMKRITQLLDER